MKLTDKSAIINRSESGIGLAVALFAEEGADVAVTYPHNQKAAEATKRLLGGMGGHALVVQTDVREAGQVAKLFEETGRQLQPFILVNDAGVDAAGDEVAEMKLEWALLGHQHAQLTPGKMGKVDMVPIVLTMLLFSSLALAQTSLDEGLVASYAFQGNAVDASSQGNDAEVQGATLTEGYDGEAESAYSLGGTDDYLVIPHSESLSLDTRATFSLWWKHEPQASQDEYYTLFEKSDPERGGHSRYGMWLIGDHVEVCIEAPDSSAQNCLDSTGALDAGWHHLAASYDGAALRVYLDGELSGERTVEPSGISQSTFEIFVGTDRYAPEPIYARGVIDEFRIYNRALNKDEIATLAEAKE